MKTNNSYLYLAGAVVLIIIAFAVWGKSGDEGSTEQVTVETSDAQTSTDSPSTPNTPSTPSASGGVKPPTSSAGTSAGANMPAPSTSPETPNQSTTQYVPSASSLDGSIFQVALYNGFSIPPGYRLSFDSGALTAKFCNNLSGNFVLDGTKIKANNLISTRMYCTSPDYLMEMESAFSSMLNFGATIYRSGNTIIISNANTVMVFDEF